MICHCNSMLYHLSFFIMLEPADGTQCSPFITLCLGSIGTDRVLSGVIKGQFYKGIIGNNHSFVKFHSFILRSVMKALHCNGTNLHMRTVTTQNMHMHL